MDLIHLILNNGYNPYLIKGYGGLGYIPPYNIIGGTLTEKEKRERLGQLLNEDEDDNELAVTKLLKDVSKLKFIPVLQKTPDISELIKSIPKKPMKITRIVKETEPEETEPEEMQIEEESETEEDFEKNTGIKFINAISNLHNAIITAKIKPEFNIIEREIDALEDSINKLNEKKFSLLKTKTKENLDIVNKINDELKELNNQLSMKKNNVLLLQQNAGLFMSGGEKAELFQTEYPDYFLPVKKYMEDNGKITSNEQLVEEFLTPNEEVNLKWKLLEYNENMKILGWGKSEQEKKKLNEDRTNFLNVIDNMPDSYGINILLDDENKKRNTQIKNEKQHNPFLYPWKTIPIDNSTDKVEYEVKNYTDTGGRYKGETIKPTILKYIMDKQKLKLTPEQIEKQAEKDGIKIPTIPVTRSKLTGYKGNTNRDRNERLIYKRNPSTGKIQPDKLVFTDIYVPKGNELVKLENGEKIELNISGNKRLVYDILINNARIFYLPLEDTNAELTDDGRLILPYTTVKHDGAGESYSVPITRMRILPPRTVIQETNKIKKEIDKYKNIINKN